MLLHMKEPVSELQLQLIAAMPKRHQPTSPLRTFDEADNYLRRVHLLFTSESWTATNTPSKPSHYGCA